MLLDADRNMASALNASELMHTHLAWKGQTEKVTSEPNGSINTLARLLGASKKFAGFLFFKNQIIIDLLRKSLTYGRKVGQVVFAVRQVKI